MAAGRLSRVQGDEEKEMKCETAIDAKGIGCAFWVANGFEGLMDF